jgi:hypothetical protein
MSIQKYVATVPDAQVSGAAILALAANIRSQKIRPILEKHGVANVDAARWYPQQTLCDIYRDITSDPDTTYEELVAIGMKTMETVEFPAETNSIEDALQMLPAMYGAIHQHADANEGWQIVRRDDHTLNVVFTSPYSDAAAFGYLFTIANRFKPAGTTASVHVLSGYDEDGPTTFEIKVMAR